MSAAIEQGPRRDRRGTAASETVAANVRSLRLAQRLSIAKLAKRCQSLGGVSLTIGSLSNLERGQMPGAKRLARQVTVDDLVVLAAALGTTPGDLLRNDDGGDDLTLLYDRPGSS